MKPILPIICKRLNLSDPLYIYLPNEYERSILVVYIIGTFPAKQVVGKYSD